jgi:hypothetical protein
MVVLLVAVSVVPASAQQVGISCPDSGPAAAICQNIAPFVNVVLQVITVAVGFVLLLWFIRILH